MGPQANKFPLMRSPADLAVIAASDFMNSPRRERFVFRPNHLEILDRAFQDDSYPSHERRETIAKDCNAVTEAIGTLSSSTCFNSAVFLGRALISVVVLGCVSSVLKVPRRWDYRYQSSREKSQSRISRAMLLLECARPGQSVEVRFVVANAGILIARHSLVLVRLA